jgi:transposase
MPRGKYLNSPEKAVIKSLSKRGASSRDIALEIGRSKTVVNNFLAKGDDYGKKAKTAGNTKITQRQKQQLLSLASKGKHSVMEIVRELDLPIKKTAAWNIIKQSGRLKYSKRQKTPALTQQHIAARLAWAQQYMPWTTEWTNVVFSDEKKFNLDGPDGYQHYWHDLRKEPQLCTRRNFGGGSLMLWAGFSMYGKTPLAKCDTRMNSQKYIDMLDDVLIPFTDDLMDGDFVFQQDNAAIHVSRLSKTWFEDKDIELLDHPPCSPDLNPMENLWGILARAVYSNGRQYSSVNQLYVAVCNAWREIPQKVLENLVDSMPKRVFEVIKAKGKQLKNY